MCRRRDATSRCGDVKFRKCQMDTGLRPSLSRAIRASINSFHFEQLHLQTVYFVLYLFSYVNVWVCVCVFVCKVLLNLPQFEIVASQVRVLSLSLRSCSTSCCPAAFSSSSSFFFVRRGRMLIIISSVRLSVRLSVCLPLVAARNFVGKLRLMIMFNELYNKYIEGSQRCHSHTAHGTWTPKIAGK